MSGTVGQGSNTEPVPVRNALIPKEGPKMVSAIIPFSTAPSTVFTVDLTLMVQQEKLSNIQTVYIDGKNSQGSILIVVEGSQFSIQLPAYSQGFFPLLVPGAPRFYVSAPGTSPNGDITLFFLNVPMPSSQWSALFDGALIVQDVTADAALSTIAGAIANNASGVSATSTMAAGASYNSVLPTLVDGSQHQLEIDVNGRLIVTQPLTSGPVAPGTAAANSRLIGAVYNSTPPAVANGQQVALQVDAAGNLKVNELDGLTGTLTGSSAAVMTGVGAAGVIDTLGYESLNFQITANASSNTVTVEQSDDGTTWATYSPTSSGQSGINWVTSVSSVGQYEGPLSARYLRFRISSFVSGSTTIVPMLRAMPYIQRIIGQVAGAPIYAGLVARSVTSGSPSGARIQSLASTNATSVKNAAGNVFTLQVANNGAALAYFKWYNKASTPVPGTDTPIMTIALPINGAPVSMTWPLGKTFGNGIAYAITALAADSDTTAVAANQVTGAFDYA